MQLVADIRAGLQALLFPRTCYVCGREIGDSERQICVDCRESLPRTHFEDIADNPAEQKFWGRVNLHSAFSAFYYRKDEMLQRLIHAFKYYGNREMAQILGREVGLCMQRRGFDTDYDFLVPVPLHPRKQKLRGYNQSECIALGIREIIDMPIGAQFVRRHLYADSQTHQNKFSRWETASQSYSLGVDPAEWNGVRLLLVDDVLTTGSTIESCCNVLQQIPNVRLGFVTVGFSTL